jgi:hypothetical protein
VDLQKLLEYANDIPPLVEGIPPWRIEPAVEHLFEAEEWELISLLLLAVAEPTARQMIDRLLTLRKYEPLVVAACLRRHIRAQPYVMKSGSGIASRVFRDIDAVSEEDVRGVPEHIMEEIRDMAETSERTRQAQMLRSESMDRGPMREFIINRLAERLMAETAALDALVVIARAAAWEETRRIAAMKIANHAPSVRKLASAGRTKDLIRIAKSSQLSAVERNMAAAMAEHLDELAARGDTEALEFIAQNHEDEAVKRTAREKLQHS